MWANDTLDLFFLFLSKFQDVDIFYTSICFAYYNVGNLLHISEWYLGDLLLYSSKKFHNLDIAILVGCSSQFWILEHGISYSLSFLYFFLVEMNMAETESWDKNGIAVGDGDAAIQWMACEPSCMLGHLEARWMEWCEMVMGNVGMMAVKKGMYVSWNWWCWAVAVAHEWTAVKAQMDSADRFEENGLGYWCCDCDAAAMARLSSCRCWCN